MPLRRALKIAQERGLDLVEVAPNANPPVCKILDYGRYRYEQEKLAKEAKKKQKGGDVKTLQVRPTIGAHDLEVKIRNTIQFLQDGDKVKFIVAFRGREAERPEAAEKLLRKIAAAVEEYGSIERQPTMEGRHMVMVLAPLRKPAPKPKPSAQPEGGSQHAQDENMQNRSQAVQAHGDGQTDAQEGREQPPVSE